MQDSIEDYIRISENCKEGSTQVRKEVAITSQIKKECDAKAMQILHFAIEGKMRSDALLRCLPYINQSHYQDIIEERAISKLCGYPLCSKSIPDMPKKQFYISTKDNRVYDITDRKNYCSNFCYRASVHVKSQIDTTPLWLRKHNERAHFTLLNNSEKGLPGELVNQGIIKQTTTTIFTSVSAFTQMSLDEAEELELKPEEEDLKKHLKKPKKFQKNLMKTINENEEVELGNVSSEDSKNEKESKSNSDKESCSKEKRRVVMKHTEVHCEKNKSHSKLINKSEIEIHIYKCIKEWLTVESFIFIYGEEKVKEKLNRSRMGDYFETLKIAELETEHKKRYMEICKKLHLREIADEKFDKCAIGNHQLNPIPDYQQLKVENRQLNLKVKTFYAGELCTKEDTNSLVLKQENESIEDGCSPTVLPLIDVNSQTALRRKIFLNSLNKTIHVLFEALQANPNEILSDLQGLVKTFKLRADNITFKPKVWNYIAIVLLKILSIKSGSLKHILNTDRSKKQLDLWLSTLMHKGQLVDDILKIFCDIEGFVENYILCK